MAATKQIRIDTNADFEMWARWLRPLPPEDTGLPYALSDAWMQVRLTAKSPVLVEASVTNTRVTVNPTSGWAKIVIPKAAMSAMVSGAALYDLIVTRTSDGRVRRLLQGQAIIDTGVTHA